MGWLIQLYQWWTQSASERACFRIIDCANDLCDSHLQEMVDLLMAIQELRKVRRHTRDCGTKYRGCAPECTFHDQE